MSVLKCKMCGGDLEVQEGMSVCECEYCGSKQTVPFVDNEKKLTLFARANRLRSACEFDKASGVYESIAAEFPEEAEAYWGMLLCKYGIEYVDDPVSGKKVPTCHRSSFDSIMEDADFEMVMENADTVSRSVYREEAKAIEALRTGIIEVSSKEEPYDIFICYKETDLNGERTIDSVLAQDIYDELTEKGYRVFFSRITLEDKLGQEYEPYIFAALHSAKVMLAIGTDYEYYNAVWVKNEWSRFLSLMEKGEKKTLIPCFKNLDAYDMPKEFARLQAQDLGKVGAVQDLLRGIGKILGEKKMEAVQQGANAGVPDRSGELENLLKAANMDLEDKKYDTAKERFDRAIEINCECAEGYLGLALAELHNGKEEFAARYIEDDKEFGNAENEWKVNMKRAKRFAAGELKDWLDALEKQREKRREEKAALAKEKDALAEEKKAWLQPFRERNAKARDLLMFDIAYVAAIMPDGSVLMETREEGDTSGWENIKKLVSWRRSARIVDLFGIKADGTVVTTGGGIGDAVGVISGWTGILDMCCGDHFMIGLKKNGAVINVGRDRFKMDTDTLKNIVAIDINDNHAVGLTKDGKVIVNGYDKVGECKTEDWTNVVSVKAGSTYTLALRANGTVLSAGEWHDGRKMNTDSWKDIVELQVYGGVVVGIRKDGTLVCDGCKPVEDEKKPAFYKVINEWTDIVQVVMSYDVYVGLKADGTVVGFSENASMKKVFDEMKGWKNIVAISATYHRVAGIQADGSVVYACLNESEKFHVSGWRLFRSIDTLEEEREEVNRRREREKEEERLRIAREREEEQRRREEKRCQLEDEKQQLIEEAANLKGLFTGKRRKEIEKQVEEIVEELKCLS